MAVEVAVGDLAEAVVAGVGEEMAMMTGKAQVCSDGEWQARVELASAYRLTV